MHKLISRDSGRPHLRLVIKDKKDKHIDFITDPIDVAARHTQPCANTWNAYNPDFGENVVKYVK